MPKKEKVKLQRNKQILVAGVWVGAFVAVYIVGVINPFTGNYLKYPYYEFFCGRKPIITSSIMRKSYYTPDMQSYRIVTLDGGLYCTEEDAQAAGYHKSSSL